MAATAAYTTTGTVSNPLDLASLNPQGAFETVHLNGNSNGKKQVRPLPKVTLTSLTINNLGTVKKIHSVVIPIVYSEKFYKDILDPSLDDVNKLVYYGDIPVGVCCSRFENLASKDAAKPATLVILTLAILAPYRSLSLGTALVKHALHSSIHPTTPPPPTPSTTGTNTRASLTPAPPRKAVNRALVHVQVGNADAKRFYERLGFKETEVVENYYSKMEPRAASLMVLDDIASALGEKPTSNGSS
ncbi:hypothetical protein P7C73_g6306, partial [Tremellales sp. Uapishka_1]